MVIEVEVMWPPTPNTLGVYGDPYQNTRRYGISIPYAYPGNMGSHTKIYILVTSIEVYIQ